MNREHLLATLEVNIMNTGDIEKALKGRLGGRIIYAGVYAADKIPFIPLRSKPTIFISNTLSSDADIRIMGHWVCFYVEYSPIKRIIFFDSYGLSPALYNKFFYDYITHTYYNDYSVYSYQLQLQPDTSIKCGLYATLFIHYTSHYGLEKFEKLIQQNFSLQKLSNNDQFVTKYFLKHLSHSCNHWRGRKYAIMTLRECRNKRKWLL